jgi:hypothetical protein
MNILTEQDKQELLKLRPFFRMNIVFPHVVEKIFTIWGSLDMTHYMADLFLDTRNNTRQGFPEEALKDLYRILDYHDRLFSEFLHQIEVKSVGTLWK